MNYLHALVLAVSIMTAAHASPIPECRTIQLRTVSDAGAAAGTTYVSVSLRNISQNSCTLKGYPHLQVVDAHGRELKKIQYHRMNPPEISNEVLETPKTLVLKNGDRAEFLWAMISGSGALEPIDKARSCVDNARLVLKIGAGAITLDHGEFCSFIRVTSYRKPWDKTRDED